MKFNEFIVNERKILSLHQSGKVYYGEKDFPKGILKISKEVTGNDIANYNIKLIFYVTVVGQSTIPIEKDIEVSETNGVYVSEPFEIGDDIILGIGLINIGVKFIDQNEPNKIGITNSVIMSIYDKQSNSTACVTPGGTGESTIVKVDGTIINVGDVAELHTTGEYSIENPLSTNKDILDLDSSKQDVIEDIEAIRSGAEKGETSVQPEDLNSYAKDTDVAEAITLHNISNLSHNDLRLLIQGLSNLLSEKEDASNKVNSVDDATSTVQYPSIKLLMTQLGMKQNTINSDNKLDSGLIDDSTSTNKFVTSDEKNNWNGKQNAISDLATIRQNASLGATAVQQNKVKSAYSTTQGDVYDVTYINSVVGDVETALDEIRGVSV